MKKNKQTGYSLLEISLVLVIVSVAVGLFWQTRQQQLETDYHENIGNETVDEILRIGEAARTYFIERDYTWPNATGEDADDNGVPDGGCAAAINELKNLANPNTTITANITAGSEREYYLGEGINNLTPYAVSNSVTNAANIYTTRCDRNNFYIELWVNSDLDGTFGGDPDATPPTAPTRMNVLHAGYVANSLPEAQTCNTVDAGLGNDPGQCLINYPNPNFTAGSGLPQFVQPNERVLVSFPRPDAWLARQFLAISGGTLTGDVAITSGGNLIITSGSNIILPDGRSITDAVPSFNILTFSNRPGGIQVPQEVPLKGCDNGIAAERVQAIPLTGVSDPSISNNDAAGMSNTQPIIFGHLALDSGNPSAAISRAIDGSSGRQIGWAIDIANQIYLQQENLEITTDSVNILTAGDVLVDVEGTITAAAQNLASAQNLIDYEVSVLVITYCDA